MVYIRLPCVILYYVQSKTKMDDGMLRQIGKLYGIEYELLFQFLHLQPVCIWLKLRSSQLWPQHHRHLHPWGAQLLHPGIVLLQPLCHYNPSQSSHHDRTRRGRSTQSSSGKLTLILPFDISFFSIEVSQEVTEDSDPSEEVEPQYDCGKSVGTIFNAICTLYIDVQQYLL